VYTPGLEDEIVGFSGGGSNTGREAVGQREEGWFALGKRPVTGREVVGQGEGHLALEGRGDWGVAPYPSCQKPCDVNAMGTWCYGGVDNGEGTHKFGDGIEGAHKSYVGSEGFLCVSRVAEGW
jgi:hypothetical protein